MEAPNPTQSAWFPQGGFLAEGLFTRQGSLACSRNNPITPPSLSPRGLHRYTAMHCHLWKPYESSSKENKEKNISNYALYCKVVINFTLHYFLLLLNKFI